VQVSPPCRNRAGPPQTIASSVYLITQVKGAEPACTGLPASSAFIQGTLSVIKLHVLTDDQYRTKHNCKSFPLKRVNLTLSDAVTFALVILFATGAYNGWRGVRSPGSLLESVTGRFCY
jgi:hypothetical protein